MPDQIQPRWTGQVVTNDLTTTGDGARAEQESPLGPALAFLALLRRHLALVLFIGVMTSGLVVYRLRREPPLYRASAVIRLVDKARELSGTLGNGLSNPGYRPFTDPVLSQIQVLQSRAVAKSVVEREGRRLQLLPRRTLPTWLEGVQVAENALPDTFRLTFSASDFSVRSRRGDSRANYGSPVDLAGVRFTVPRNPGIGSAQMTIIPLETAIGEVADNLRGHPRERTDVIDVSFLATDPLEAQRTVNDAVSAFQALGAQAAKQQSVLRRVFVEQQLGKVQQMLSEAQAQHNAFRSRNKVYSAQEKFRNQQQDLTSIEMRRQELDADRRLYTGLLEALRQGNMQKSSAERLSSLAASPGIAENPVISHLFSEAVQLQATRDSLTTGSWSRASQNPDVKRLDTLIASTQSRIIEGVRAQVAFVEARIAALDDLKQRVSGNLASLPATEAEEGALQAQVETYEKEAERLRQELQSAQIAEAAEAGQVEIVDLATLPSVPIGTGHTPKIVLALLFGLGLGAAAAYVIENYRPVIRRRDELERAIAIPSLALVPQIRLGGANGAVVLGRHRLLPRLRRFASTDREALPYTTTTDLVTVSNGRSSGAEAYRTLRTNLLFSAAVRALRKIVITSPGPAEGKSTTAANLAIAFAQQGHRVLLLDCDLRRARIHKMFDETQIPGLTNVLVGGTPISEAVRRTRVEGLMIMPSGALPPNPAELLGSRQMQTLLDTLSQNYDLLIVDTPPLLAASDAAILSRISDGALVVVRAGRTERTALQTAIQQLATVGARILGTVLNDPDAEVPKYARYYGYYYNNYYQYTSSNGSPA